MKPFYRKPKEDQTVDDVLDYYDELEGDHYMSYITGITPLSVRGPEEFFSKELLERSKLAVLMRKKHQIMDQAAVVRANLDLLEKKAQSIQVAIDELTSQG